MIAADVTARRPGDVGRQPAGPAPVAPAPAGAAGAPVVSAQPAPADPAPEAAAEPGLTDLAASWEGRVRSARWGAGGARPRPLPGPGRE
ncbi:hypothetical protein [Pseudofrankia sp. DC12]|uniref:hypothetical protein n=1 Tax=Pseudofrankia sp. DC12 TaxID=683315 RepID=UPI0005F7F6C8|nr:hypothetical protein [Pseudofrankia sp. DC12]